MKSLLPTKAEVISAVPTPPVPLQEANHWALDAGVLLLLFVLASGYSSLGIYLLRRWGGYDCQFRAALLLGALFTLSMSGLMVCYASALGERHPFVIPLGLGSVPGVVALLYALAQWLLPGFRFSKVSSWLTSTVLYCVYLVLPYLAYRAFFAIVLVFVLYILLRGYSRPPR